MKIEDLRKLCQEEKLTKNKGLVLLNRRISIYVTRFFIGRSIQADSVTIASIIAGIAGSFLFLMGDWQYNIVGVILLYVSFLLDQVDGELARYYRSVSLSGVYLDEIRHLVIYSLAVFCLSFPAARDLGSRLPYLMGFVGAIALVIARVQERLPRLIFTEKIVLKENFAGGDECGGACDEEKEDGGCVRKSSPFKAVTALLYKAAELLSQQTALILWLLLVTLIDRFVLPAHLLGGHAAQTVFFALFTCICPLAALGIVWGHYRNKTAEKECRRIGAVLRN